MAATLSATVPAFAAHTRFFGLKQTRTHARTPWVITFLALCARTVAAQQRSIKTVNLHLRTLEEMQGQYRNKLNLISSRLRYDLHTYWHSCFKGSHKALRDKPG